MGTVTRRTLLLDLGRATLGAILISGISTGCTDGDETGPGAGAGDDGTPSGGDGETPRAGGAGSEPDGTGSWQRASFGFVSAYVLVRGGEALVFDTGTGDDIGPIGDALAAAGVGWDAVGHVLVSHQHQDHAGGLGLVVAEAPDAAVYGGMPDLDEFRDRAGAAREVVEVVDGDAVMGLRVVATPGHTAGHVSALDEANGLLLVGDALVNGVAIGGATGAGVELSPPEFTADAAAAAASGRTLAGLTFEVALFGHGEPITSGADSEVAAAIG